MGSYSFMNKCYYFAGVFLFKTRLVGIVTQAIHIIAPLVQISPYMDINNSAKDVRGVNTTRTGNVVLELQIWVKRVRLKGGSSPLPTASYTASVTRSCR